MVWVVGWDICSLKTLLYFYFEFQNDHTALHYAASSGLKACVEMLVSHNAPLFMENKETHTPCDSAESFGFNDIALYLESKMVFSVSFI